MSTSAAHTLPHREHEFQWPRQVARLWNYVKSRASIRLTIGVLERILHRRQLERMYLVFGGHIFFQTLVSAVRFDLLSLLAKRPGITVVNRHRLPLNHGIIVGTKL